MTIQLNKKDLNIQQFPEGLFLNHFKVFPSDLVGPGAYNVNESFDINHKSQLRGNKLIVLRINWSVKKNLTVFFYRQRKQKYQAREFQERY